MGSEAEIALFSMRNDRKVVDSVEKLPRDCLRMDFRKQ